MKQRKILIISGTALLVCLVSAILAANIQVADVDGVPDWDSFGKAIWITVLVTVPSFCIFVVMGIVAIIKSRKK